MTARYQVYISDKIDELGEYDERLVPSNARRQERGLGSATIDIKLNNISRKTPPLEGEEPKDFSNAFPYKIGQFIRIIDIYLIGQDKPSTDDETFKHNGCVWFGYVQSLSQEIAKKGTDFRGQLFCDEIGQYISQILCTKGYFDQDDRELASPPNFNSVRDGRYSANMFKGPDGVQAIRIKNTEINDIIYRLEYDPSLWKELPNDIKWSRADIISFLIDGNMQKVTIDGSEQSFLTWDTSPLTSETENKFLSSTEIAESFPSYYGSSLTEAFDDLIEEPLSWYYDYSSNINHNTIDLKVFSKTQEGTTYDIPQATPQVLEINDVNQSLISVNLNSTQLPITNLTVRGKPIVVCGSMSPNSKFLSSTLIPDWDNIDIDQFILTREADQNSNVSEDAFLNLQEAEETDSFRSSYPRIYSDFKFLTVPNIKAPIIGVDDPSNHKTTSNQEQKPWFPNFEFYEFDETGEIIKVLQTPKVSFDLGTGHSTPTLDTVKFLDWVPFEYEYTRKVGDREETFQLAKRKKPMVWGYGISGTSAGSVFYWHDLLSSGSPFKSQLEFLPNGLRLNSPLKVLLSFDSKSAIYWLNEAGGDTEPELTNPYSALLQRGEWRDPDRNYPPGTDPVTTKRQFPWQGHWSKLVFTVAMESDIRVQAQRDQLDIVNGELVTNPGDIRRVIEVDHEIWFVKKGTVIDTIPLREETGNVHKLKVVDNDMFIRNDLPKTLKLADVAFDWLNTHRESVSLVFAMNNFNTNNYGWSEIGSYIKDVKEDGKDLRNTNSTVSSIEYTFGDNPRINISTEIPREPAFQKLMEARYDR